MMSVPPLRLFTAIAASVLLLCGASHAQDPAVDVNKMIQSLKGLQDQSTTQVKSMKQAAIQQVTAAAGNPASAITLWQNAIRAMQMEGAGKENATFRAWRDTEGEVFKEREVQSAVHLNLEWLALSLQRSNGTSVKDLLTSIINYTTELLADQGMMESLEEKIKAEQDIGKAEVGPKRETQGKLTRSDVGIKKAHDSILNQNITSTAVAQWLKVGGFLNMEGWELNPGNFDGIYKQIVQPELRGELDQRVFAYWDAKLRTEADRATRSRLNYEIEKFNILRRPALLWGRAEEYAYLGQTNRAATEMFTIIKTYPTHPDAADWIAELQKMLAPPAPGTGAAPPAVSTAPAPGAPVAAPPAQ